MSENHVADAAEVEFARQVAELTTKLGTPEAWDGIGGLRAVEEAWARHLLGLGAGEPLHQLVQARVQDGVELHAAELALLHLRAAEEQQWAIGSAATGSGEGLASMSQVHGLRMAQAWLEAGIARARTARARQLVNEVEHAANGLGKTYQESLNELTAFLARP